MKKARILLIGAKGFFGKNIIFYLKKKYNFRLVGRKDNIDKINLKKFDFLINCAAEVYDDNKMFKNNTTIVEKLLKKIIKENKEIKIIHFGSSSEYGELKRPASEKHSLNPRTVYEATKGSSSLLILGYSNQYNLKIILVRPFAIYGPYENVTRLLPNIFRNFLYNSELKIFDGYHDFVYINDMVRFIDFLLKKNKNFFNNKVINFGSGKQYSNLEVLKICEKIFKRKSVCKVFKSFQRSYDSKIWKSDNKYLVNNINFKLKYNMFNGLKSYIKRIKEEKINIKKIPKKYNRKIII